MSGPLTKFLAIINCFFTFTHQDSLFLKAKIDERRKLFIALHLKTNRLFRDKTEVFRRMAFYVAGYVTGVTNYPISENTMSILLDG